MSSSGPSTRAVCRILNQNSCGSGSICGIRENGNALILTNAHVAGSRIGRIVTVEVESTGDRIQARVIQAAYSGNTWTDWAVLETLEPYSEVHPVKLSKNRPTGSHYTKGFPRCRAFAGSDIRTVRLADNSALWLWQPDAISGQSGSGVWSDSDNLQYGLLTWSVGRDGGGQMTSEIYRQARNCTVSGEPRIEGMKELDDFEIDYDTNGLDDPEVIEGFVTQRNITSLPIWHEDDDGGGDVVPPNDGGDTSPTQLQKIQIENHRKLAEHHEDMVRKLQGLKPPQQAGEQDPDNEDTVIFGLPLP